MAQDKEVRLFAGGGVDSDSSRELVKPNDWIYSLSVRNSNRRSGEDGIITNLKGNELVSFSLPTGTNQVIGSGKDENNGKLYYAVYNSLGNHAIFEYNSITNTIATVILSSLLNFSLSHPVLDMDVIDGLLYWNDAYNPPRKVNIEKAKSGGYGTLTDEFISAAKVPSTKPIVAVYKEDITYKQNQLKRQLFQFSQLFVKDDAERSAWSTWSKMPLPDGEINPDTDTVITKNNYIELTIDCGTILDTDIEIAANVNNGSAFYLIASLKRSEIILSSDYDATTNTYKYKFYNNDLYTAVDSIEFELPFDNIPQLAGSQAIVNGNQLLYGDVTEGYDNVAIDIDIAVTYNAEQPGFGLSMAVYEDKYFEDLDIIRWYYLFSFSGTPLVGDVIAIEIANVYYTTYTVVEGDTLSSTVDAFITLFNPSGNSDVFSVEASPDDPATLVLKLNDNIRVTDSSVTLDSGSAVAASTSGIKLNSKYNAGIVYYDKYGRFGAVNTSSDSNFTTNSYGKSEGAFPTIGWAINSIPPVWAHSYQLVFTKNRTHQNFLYWRSDAAPATVIFDEISYYTITIDRLNTYNEVNKSSVLAYDFTKGDRISIYKDGSTWITDYDVEVVSYDAETYTLRFPKKTGVTLSSNLLFEIYTPLKSIGASPELYYEIGERYSIINPETSNRLHVGQKTNQTISSPATGVITGIDIYVKKRSFPTVATYPYSIETLDIEDPNYSDFYQSNYWSNGRGNIPSESAKRLPLYDSIRVSQMKNANSSVNGLSRFYAADIVGANIGILRSNGAIRKLSHRDNALIVYQQSKVGVIPVKQVIYEDVSGQQTVSISEQLLNQIRYVAGDYGIGNNPESHCKSPRSEFFADVRNGKICEFINGGIRTINQGKDGYWTNTLKKVSINSSYKIISSYDDFNEEVNFTYLGDINETLCYDTARNRWNDNYPFIPEHGNYIGSKYVTFKDGALYTHEANNWDNFYGVQYLPKIRLVFNKNADVNKTFNSIYYRANRLLITSVNGIETNISQVSELYDWCFLKSELVDGETTIEIYENEGVYSAPLLKDKNDNIINGSDLKGNYITVELTPVESGELKLFLVGVHYSQSKVGVV